MVTNIVKSKGSQTTEESLANINGLSLRAGWQVFGNGFDGPGMWKLNESERVDPRVGYLFLCVGESDPRMERVLEMLAGTVRATTGGVNCKQLQTPEPYDEKNDQIVEKLSKGICNTFDLTRVTLPKPFHDFTNIVAVAPKSAHSGSVVPLVMSASDNLDPNDNNFNVLCVGIADYTIEGRAVEHLSEMICATTSVNYDEQDRKIINGLVASFCDAFDLIRLPPNQVPEPNRGKTNVIALAQKPNGSVPV